MSENVFTWFEEPQPAELPFVIGDIVANMDKRAYIVTSLEYAEPTDSAYSRKGFRVPLSVLAKAMLVGKDWDYRFRFKATRYGIGNQLAGNQLAMVV